MRSCIPPATRRTACRCTRRCAGACAAFVSASAGVAEHYPTTLADLLIDESRRCARAGRSADVVAAESRAGARARRAAVEQLAGAVVGHDGRSAIVEGGVQQWSVRGPERSSRCSARGVGMMPRRRLLAAAVVPAGDSVLGLRRNVAHAVSRMPVRLSTSTLRQDPELHAVHRPHGVARALRIAAASGNRTACRRCRAFSIACTTSAGPRRGSPRSSSPTCKDLIFGTILAELEQASARPPAASPGRRRSRGPLPALRPGRAAGTSKASSSTRERRRSPPGVPEPWSIRSTRTRSPRRAAASAPSR